MAWYCPKRHRKPHRFLRLQWRFDGWIVKCKDCKVEEFRFVNRRRVGPVKEED